jgi:RNA polymerase sigma factor (sigma-70 family)
LRRRSERRRFCRYFPCFAGASCIIGETLVVAGGFNKSAQTLRDLPDAETAGHLHATFLGRFGIMQVMAPRAANSSIEANPAESERASPEPAAHLLGSSTLSDTVERCWRKAGAPAEWNLTREQFVAALERSIAHHFKGALNNDNAVETYLTGLQLSDLALARACSAGNSAAWDFFVTRFRPELYRAARAIVGDANARELADSLYADLYGVGESEGRRKSLFDYFHGRSKLSTWLRAVLVQRHVDEIRRIRKTEPLEVDSGRERQEIAARATAAHASAHSPLDPERANYLAVLQAALTTALGSLDPRDRLRLAYYYADERTLAEIGRLLGEHEATVSRKLERTRREVRRRVEAALREDKKWTEAQVRLCLEYACEEWPFALPKSVRHARSSLQPTAQPDAASAQD